MSAAISTTSTDSSHLNEVLGVLGDIATRSLDGDYLYRGEPRCYNEVSSSLYREYKNIEAEYFDINSVQNEILEAAKSFTAFTDDEDTLTQLQHFGYSTNLIDFTNDYLIALYFACNSHLTSDGRVLLLERETYPTIAPRHPQNRVRAQKSIFVRPPSGTIDPSETVIIPHHLKEPILGYLRKCHNIAMSTIYNDLHGFIKYYSEHRSAYAAFYLGLTHSNRGDYEGAIPYYSESIKLNPEVHVPYHNRGTAYGELQMHDLALADYDRALDLSPKSCGTYSNRGNLHLQMSNLDLAYQDFRTALDIEPTHLPSHVGLGNVLFARGSYVQAIGEHSVAIGLEPENKQALANRGEAYSSSGHPDLAIRDFEKVLSLDSTFVGIHSNIGKAYAFKGDHDKAIRHYDLEIALKPTALAYSNRAAAWIAMREYGRAIDDSKTAIDLDEKYDSAYLNRAIALNAKGLHKEAISDADRVMELVPKSAPAYNTRGDAYRGMGRVELALKDFSRAISIDPSQAMYFNNRGTIYIEHEDITQAICDFDRAIELDPEVFIYYVNRGTAWRACGFHDRAIDDYSMAIRLEETFAISHFGRGICWLTLKDWTKAETDFDKSTRYGLSVEDVFRIEEVSVPYFERKHSLSLPSNIVRMLTGNASGS